MMNDYRWLDKPVKGVLLDITGVLYESGDGFGTVITGSVEAVQRLKSLGIPLRLLTNETTTTEEAIVKKLNHHGYSFVKKDIFSPIPAVKSLLKEHGLRPHLFVHPAVEKEFKEFDQSHPNCVVLGDADREFSFSNMNKALNVLLNLKNPVLYSLGKGKYYRHEGRLQIDVGAYAAALEYACNVKATIIGKPSPKYFKAALDDIKIAPDDAIMVGDDINSDIGGAQCCGMRGILVKTGKFTPDNLTHPSIQPDFIADNLAQVVDCIVGSIPRQ